MLSASCTKCNESFPLKLAKLDPHWKRPSLDAVTVYCPRCEAELEDVDYRSVDFARSVTLRKVLAALVWFSLFGLGVLTDTLRTMGPILVAGIGLWLAMTSISVDHKRIGWVLVVIAGGIYVLSSLVAT